MVYAGSHSDSPPVSDMEKLYAFGIDAYRLATALLSGFDLAREPLDGVTGRIWLGADRHLVRELTAAQFVDGRAVPIASRP
jgi:outer membrane PBP1 activator LpoA protein